MRVGGQTQQGQSRKTLEDSLKSDISSNITGMFHPWLKGQEPSSDGNSSVCGAAGRSSELNKPKGEGWWGWGEEVEERVEEGGGWRTQQGPPRGACRLVFWTRLHFVLHSPRWLQDREWTGRGGPGRGGGDAGSFPVFLMEGRQREQGRAGPVERTRWRHVGAKSIQGMEQQEARRRAGPRRTFEAGGRVSTWGGGPLGRSSCRRPGCRGGRAPGEAEKQRELPAGLEGAHLRGIFQVSLVASAVPARPQRARSSGERQRQ